MNEISNQVVIGPARLSENEISKLVVDAAFHIHQEIGPGLLESVYEVILAHKLQQHGLHVIRQRPISIRYEDHVFEEGFRADLIVNDCVIVEIKSVVQAVAVFKKQLLTYLRMTDMRLGILINFGEELFKDGCFRVVNNLNDDPLAEAKARRRE